jgi:transposase
MLGLLPEQTHEPPSCQWLLIERHVPADHLLRRVDVVLNLDFVIPAVRPHYGRSGHKSLDPRVVLKMMLLLFLYNISSERELMEQIQVRLDFLWFLRFDLETAIPDHSVSSKARARWGPEVFDQLFRQTVKQCVAAGLVDGRLVHNDSTMVKAHASKASIVAAGPELVSALRQACQEPTTPIAVLPAPETVVPPAPDPSVGEPMASPRPAVAPGANLALVPVEPNAPPGAASALPVSAAVAPEPPALQVLPFPSPLPPQASPPTDPKPATPKRSVNDTHLSLTDPTAELARSKNGLIELNYKEHRLVDDAHGVITAVTNTPAHVGDGSQLPSLIEQHQTNTGLKRGQLTVAGDHHYGTFANYLYCLQEGIRPHLGEFSANIAQRGQFPVERFVYEPEQDRWRCPQGHYLGLHQHRREEQVKVYLIEDPQQCAQCPLRTQCTKAKGGRSIQRHEQAELIAAAVAEAHSPAGQFSRQRRQQVMEGSFADAANNHGAKRARWRGLGRQSIQSWLIAAVQNLRILLRHAMGGPEPGGVAVEKPTVQGRGAGLRSPGSWRGEWLGARWTPWGYLAGSGCL